MAEIGKNLAKAKAFLEKNDVIGIPTETVYGLAGNAFNEKAILKIFEVKNRPKFDPLIVHTNAIEKVEQFTKTFPASLKEFLALEWPGPITVLLEKNALIPDLITAGLERVAVRIPNHPLTLALLDSLDFPLAAPSANPFGYVSPTTAQHVDNQLGKKISYILDGGKCQVGVESTIIGKSSNKIVIYRKGGIEIEKIESFFGKKNVIVNEHSSSNPQAPGMLKSHYAPQKELILFENQELSLSESIGYLGFSNFLDELPKTNQKLLSPTANLGEAAHHLFAFLREIDEWDVEKVYISLVPEIGIGRAINDRIRRACSTKKD